MLGVAKSDEVQTVTVSNANGGTFRLAFNGQTTAPIAQNASAATCCFCFRQAKQLCLLSRLAKE